MLAALLTCATELNHISITETTNLFKNVNQPDVSKSKCTVQNEWQAALSPVLFLFLALNTVNKVQTEYRSDSSTNWHGRLKQGSKFTLSIDEHCQAATTLMQCRTIRFFLFFKKLLSFLKPGTLKTATMSLCKRNWKHI